MSTEGSPVFTFSLPGGGSLPLCPPSVTPLLNTPKSIFRQSGYPSSTTFTKSACIKLKSIWMEASSSSWVWIWILLPNTVEYPQHLISIPPGVLRHQFKNSCSTIIVLVKYLKSPSFSGYLKQWHATKYRGPSLSGQMPLSCMQGCSNICISAFDLSPVRSLMLRLVQRLYIPVCGDITWFMWPRLQIRPHHCIWRRLFTKDTMLDCKYLKALLPMMHKSVPSKYSQQKWQTKSIQQNFK